MPRGFGSRRGPPPRRAFDAQRVEVRARWSGVSPSAVSASLERTRHAVDALARSRVSPSGPW